MDDLGRRRVDMPEALKLAGGELTTHPADFRPNVMIDRELVTGQKQSSYI